MIGENNIALGDTIIGNRLCSNTKSQYKRKVTHFINWIESTHPEYYNMNGQTQGDGDASVELERIDCDTFKEFFGHICKKKKPDGAYINPVKYQSFQHVSGYKSAIKDYYRSKHLKMDNKVESVAI
jgi:hypothetical protein